MTQQALDYNATLIERFDITPRLAIFRVKPDEADYPFAAGQYSVLGLKRCEKRLGEADPEEDDGRDPQQMIRRPYSICSGTQQHELEFYVSMLSGGELTPRLFQLRPGARLFLGPQARGFLTLENIPTDTNLLMVATGTGLGPYISMLRTHATSSPPTGSALFMAPATRGIWVIDPNSSRMPHALRTFVICQPSRAPMSIPPGAAITAASNGGSRHTISNSVSAFR